MKTKLTQTIYYYVLVNEWDKELELQVTSTAGMESHGWGEAIRTEEVSVEVEYSDALQRTVEALQKEIDKVKTDAYLKETELTKRIQNLLAIENKGE